ncbi:MAG: hypothetical protein RBQ71_04330 [Acholeplasmataceae bacterium]|jgi:hypothetical protein|nr:hypothetical protein [Acholeplasmataceae bacterium]
MNWIKNFKNVFSPMITTIIVGVIAVYTMTQNFGGINFFDRLSNIVPALLVIIAVIGMQLKNQSLAAHLILLFTSYLFSGRALVYAVTSFDFQTLSFTANWSLELVINALIFVYLALYILSFALDKNTKVKWQSSPVVTSAVIAFVFFFFRDGFSGAILKIIPPVIALLFGSDLFAIILLLAGVADVPFNLLSRLVESTLFNQPVSYFLFAAFALYLIYGAVVGIIKNLK